MGANGEDTSKKGANEENEDVEDQNDQMDAGDEDDGDDNGKGGNKDGDKGGKSGKSFSQDQVTRMMTREKQQGRNSVFNELGIKPGDTKSIEAVKAYIKSQKTEEQLAAERDQASEAAVAEANQRAMIAEAKAEAMMLGVKSQFVEDAVTLALSKVNNDGTGDKADIKTALGELKTKYPIWFESDDEDDKGEKGGGASKKTGQKGTGSSVKADKGKDKAGAEKGMGARLAAQRKNSTPKNSFWS